MIDLDAKSKRRIESLLQDYLAGTEVRLVGSRAEGCAKPHADVDLLIMTDRPLSPKTRALLNTAFEKSDIPYKVDLIDDQDLTPEFRAALLQHSERLVFEESVLGS